MKQQKKPKKMKSKTISRRIMWPLLILLVIETLLVIGIPIGSGVFSELNRSGENILGKQVENRKNYMENAMVSDWSSLLRPCIAVKDKIQSMMEEEGLTLDEIQSDPQNCSRLLGGVASDLISEMYTKRVNGIFIMLNTQDLRPLREESRMPDCNGLYIRDLDPTAAPSSTYADLLIKRGPTDLVRALNITTDADWKPMFTFDPEEDPKNYDFLYQPFQAAYEAEEIDAAEDYGFWAPATSSWLGSSETSVTYSMPLVLDDGTVCGVVGVELLSDYLCSLLPYGELEKDELGSYVLATVRQEEDTLYLENAVVSSNTLSEQDFTSGLQLTRSPYQSTGYTCTMNGKQYYAAAGLITLYGSNTPFTSQQWALLGLVDQGSLYSTTRNTEIILGIAALLALIAGIVGSVIVCRRLSVPVRKLSDEVYQAQAEKTGVPSLSKTGITEIDHFAAAITELSREAVNTSSRFLRIIEMTSNEIGGYEMREGENVFFTDNFLSMLKLQVEDPGALSSMDFNDLLCGLSEDVPHTYLQDGSILYEIAQQTGDIRYIRVNTCEQGDALIGLAEDVTDATVERKRIEYERDYDLLTGLLNRRAFYREVDEIFPHDDQIKNAVVIMLDLDNLKQVNDKFGHEWGDQYIQQGARGFVSAAPANSLLARLSGDEFALFMYGFDSEEEARKAVDEFTQVVRKNVFIAPDGDEHRVQASGGVAWYPRDSKDFHELMKFADFAMYQIKHGEKGQLGEFDFKSYNQESFLVQNRRELQQLFEEQSVQYHFQPIINAKDGSVYAYEALMRVNMPTLRTPDAVLNLARSENRLKDIERLTMLKATESYRTLRDGNLIERDAYLFINSIADQYIDREDQDKILETCGDFVSRIVIEITECSETSLKALSEKQKMECFSGLFALDDYGSGYNSEKNLLQLAPKYVKLDICIVRGLDTDTSKQHIVSSLLNYAHERDMLVVAEGLETLSELQKALELGVDLLQGYALARPAAVPTKAAEPALELIREFWESRN